MPVRARCGVRAPHYPGPMPDGPRARRARKPQLLKPQTAANKLGIYLPAAPAEFRDAPITREDLAALEADPPAWLVELRRNGPHPRQVVTARLRVSHSALVRAGVGDALTTAQIEAIIAEAPEWLGRERASYAEVKREEARAAELRRDRAEREGS